MRPFSHFIAFLMVTAGIALAQDQNSAEARLREALRQLTVRVQTAEAEAATLKAAHAELEAKNKTLTAQVEKLIKEATADKAAADKAAAAADAKLTDISAELARTREALDQWKAGHAQVSELARKLETARAALASKVATLDHRAADLTRKNLALFKLGSEILTRLENFSYGTALAAREPFVGAARVKLENQVQGYKDQLLDPKLKP